MVAETNASIWNASFAPKRLMHNEKLAANGMIIVCMVGFFLITE
jgi:hypothetical protein